MGPGSLTGGHGSPPGTEGSEQALCAAGHASAKQAASMLWAVMDFQGGGQTVRMKLGQMPHANLALCDL